MTSRKSWSSEVGPLRGLVPFVVPYRLQIACAGFALVVTAGLALALPVTARLYVDRFEEIAGSLSSMGFLAAMSFAALLAIGSGVRYALVSRIGERVVADIRIAAFEKAISMAPAYFETVMTGEVLSRINTDTTLVLTVVGSSVSVALRNSLILGGGLVLMLVTSAKLTLLTLLIVPMILVPVLGLGRRLKAYTRDNQDRIAEGSGNASEVLLAVQAVQANTHERESKAKFGKIVERSVQSAYRRIDVRALMTICVILFTFCGITTVVWTGTRDVQAGAMSAGQLVQFVIYSVMVAGSVAALSEVWGEMVRAAGATERLIEILNAVDPVPDAVRPQAPASPARGEVVFENVSFSYPMRRQVAALRKVSFTARSDETVAIVGPSGAGKSTVFHLLLRFFDPQEGRILLDGVSIKEMDKSSFRKLLALVPQESAIFADSAMENIRFGNPEASDDEVQNAARSAAIHDFVSSLPDGYATQVGERGIMLSGGQRQRIAIARAFLRNAPLLLLDEATSALDSESEFLVRRAINDLSTNRTTIIVAHRLATVKQADRILVFDEGEIVDEGTHETLVAKGGTYTKLAKLQLI